MLLARVLGGRADLQIAPRFGQHDDAARRLFRAARLGDAFLDGRRHLRVIAAHDHGPDHRVIARQAEEAHAAAAIGRAVRADAPFRESLVSVLRHVPRNASGFVAPGLSRSEEHTSELQSLMRISYAVFCLKKKKKNTINKTNTTQIITRSIN